MRTIGLYLDLLRLDINARSQYRTDFFIGIGAALLQHLVTLGTLWLIFRNVRALGGWTAPQASVLYAIFSVTMGLVNLLGSGLRDLPQLVEMGELDGVLVLPVSPLVQLLPRFNPGALGDILLGLVILAAGGGPAGITWSVPAVLYCLWAIACGAAVILGLLIAIYSLSLWTRQSGVTTGLEEVTQLARYPSGIYPRWVQLLITWVLPVSFASFYPAAVLTGAQAMPYGVGLVAMPVAACALLAGLWLWRLGLGKYEGTGS